MDKIDVVKIKQHGNRFKNNDLYISELKNKNIKLIPLEEYSGANVKILHRCLLCENEYKASPHNILRGKEKCKKCKGKYIDKKYKDTVCKINPNIEILTIYDGNPSCKMTVKCKLCGYSWITSASTLKNHRECQNCGKVTNTISKNDFLSKIDDDIMIISDYKKETELHKCMCKKCGFIWESHGCNLVRKKAHCPRCHIKENSKGESKIMNFLDKYKIEYIYQMKYYDLIGVRNGLLSFDFYLPEYNKLIEYQGIQHEKQIENFQTKDDFLIQLEHDVRKKEYAKSHNIELLEIWYYDFENIENILIENLKLKSLETAGCA